MRQDDHLPKARYSAFGLQIESDIALNLPIGNYLGKIDLSVCVDRDPGADHCLGEPVLDSEFAAHGLQLRHQVYDAGGATVVRIARAGRFRLTDSEIAYERDAGAWPGLLERYLTTFVLSLWLERTGTPVLHGAAVEIGDGAAIFVAPGGTGKSTLAATFAGRGLRFLSDDVVGLTLVRGVLSAIPAHPNICLWPGLEFAPMLGRLEHGPPVDSTSAKRILTCPPSTFCSETRSVRAVYVLDRQSIPPKAAPVFHRLSWLETVLALVRQSMVPRHVAALGLEARRLQMFRQLATSARVVRVEYGAGLERLETLCDRILDDYEMCA